MENKQRNKFSISDKERAVKFVLEGGLSYQGVAKLLSTSHRLISLWVASYRLHELLGLSKHNKIHYTGDFKYGLISQMKDNHLSLYQVSAQYNISPSILSQWRRQYEEFGKSVLYQEKPQGRPLKMKHQKNKVPTEKVPSGPYQELLEENLRLRIENEYLKKLQALTQKNKG